MNYFNFKKDDEGKGLCKTALFAITIYYVMPQNEGENCGIKGTFFLEKEKIRKSR